MTERSLPASAVALISLACGVGLRAALEPMLQGTQLWLTFWPAVFLAAWFGGWRAGATTLLASIAIVFAWLVPHTARTDAHAVTGATVFLLCSGAFFYVREIARRGRAEERRLRETAEAARADERRLRDGTLAFATALSHATTPEEVARALVEEGATALGADVSMFAHVVDDALELVAQRGVAPALSDGARFPITSEGPLALALRTGREHVAETAAEFRAVFGGAIGASAVVGAAVALPLRVGDRTVGAAAFRFVAHSDGKGRGSRIALRLPLAPGAAVVAEPAPAPLAGPGGRRVLVVDDNHDAAEMLAELAEHRGHAARRAHDGPTALRILEQFTPDIALLDLGLPAMDGYELAERIRQLPHLARVRLVAVTGYGQPRDRERTRAAGFDLHLVKPLQLQDIVRAIEDELDPARRACRTSRRPG